MGYWRGRGKKGRYCEDSPGKKIAIAAFCWPIRARMGKTTWQKDPRFMSLWRPKSDIESGRISANGAHFGLFLHANPIRTFYGLFREGGWIGKWESGPDSGVFFHREAYLSRSPVDRRVVRS
jgi:hypothetical protein